MTDANDGLPNQELSRLEEEMRDCEKAQNKEYRELFEAYQAAKAQIHTKYESQLNEIRKRVNAENDLQHK